MGKHRRRRGGRRGVIPAATTGVCAVTGAVLIGVGLLGGPDGPPAPPESASAGEPAAAAASTRPSTQLRTGPPASPQHDNADTPVLGRSKPVGLRIPAIDVETTKFVALGTQPDGEIEVPERNDTVGWYRAGPTPGQFGPAVIGGHVDSETGPAIFYRLGELRPGAEVSVRRADNKTAVFTVYAVEQYPKSAFPTRKVYSPTHNRPELRLITCGGEFNEKLRSYRSNIVVYAKLTSVR